MRKLLVLLVMAGTGALLPASLAGQRSAVTVVPGPRYGASGLERAVLGRNRRELWLTRISAPVLDLDTLGGLTPFRRGGNQSKTLHFRSAAGTRYVFRSVDKFIDKALPSDLRGTPVGDVIQDQTSTMFPVAERVAGPLQAAAGLLFPAARLYVMPDDSRLGEFRAEYAGMLGLLFERPDEGKDDAPGFAGSTKIVSAERMLDRFEDEIQDRVDSREFLKARLLDFVLGDTDRGEDQWRWARFGPKGARVWRPIALDRDYAFHDANGLLAEVVRLVFPKLIEFDEKYPSLGALTFATPELDPILLAELDRADFDSVALSLRRDLTDETIERGVAELPAGLRGLAGPELTAKLRARRGRLPRIAAKFYERLANDVDVHATDESDRAEIRRLPDGAVDVWLFAAAQGADRPIAGGGLPGGVQAAPPVGGVVAGPRGPAGAYYTRRFLPAETDEVRVYLHGGADHAVVSGQGPAGIVVRLIGGGGDDVLADSSRVDRGTSATLYDDRGENRFVAGPATRVDRRKYEADAKPEGEEAAEDEEDEEEAGGDEASESEEGKAWTSDNWFQHKTGQDRVRDWGSSLSVGPSVDVRLGAGLVLGGGPRWVDYAFRHAPYRLRLRADGLVATGTGGLGLAVDADLRRENSRLGLGFGARATQFEAIRFFGLGNDSPDLPNDLALVMYDAVELSGGLVWHGESLRVAAGPVLRWLDPRAEPGSPMARLAPLGSDRFGQVGGRLNFALRRSDSESFPRRGLALSGGGGAYPGVWDAPGAFGEAHATAAAYVPVLSGPVLALKAGGRKVWGDFPAHEAAFVGGRHSLRGFAFERFAGDAALVGGAELRVPIARLTLLVNGELGAFALADAGRVYVDGRSPGGWHTGVGGGLWFAALGRALSVAYARGDAGRFYVWSGLPF